MAHRVPSTPIILQAICAVLAVYLCLLGAALHKRHTSLDALTERIVREATASAEHGPADYDRYLHAYPEIPWQSGAIYLFEHDRRDPRVERIILLLEARRPYDNEYIYSGAHNTDLRRWLIKQCAAQYPDDPRVAWAAGRLELAMGDFAAAAGHLGKAAKLGLDPADMGEPAHDFLGRLMTAYILSGREAELEEFFRTRAAAQPENMARLGDLAEYYCLCDQQEQVIALLQHAPALAVDPSLQAILRRAYWWSGRLTEYRQLASQAARAEGKPLYTFDPRLALLDGDHAAFDLQLPPGRSQRWQAMSAVYAVNRDPALIKELERTAIKLRSIPTASLDWSAADQIHVEADAAFAYSLRARILAGEWQQAHQLSARLGGQTDATWYSNPSLEWNLILLQVDAGKFNPEDRWFFFQALYPPAILLSKQFHQALQHHGMDKLRIYSILQREVLRDNYTYYDYGNGVFDLAAPAPASLDGSAN
jgi:hypothetical protein